MVKIDFLIVGQGLAGSLLAWYLLQRGQRILVVDRDEEETSSKVAAGLVTPIFGSGFRVDSQLEAVLPEALRFYWEREEETGLRLFHHHRTARIFGSPDEKLLWKRRLDESASRLAPYHASLEIDTTRIPAPHGGIEITGGGWLDTNAFLEATRQHLLERASYAIARVRSKDIGLDESTVTWKNVVARFVVFCEGWRAPQNHFFSGLPMKPAKGEIIDFQCDELGDERRVLHRNGWIQPLGDGRFRAGSTYDHDDITPDPTPGARDTLLARVRTAIRPPVRLTGHRAGFRPTIRQSRVVMGPHPRFPRVVLFNGLGSKGVLNGPWFASELVRCLLDGSPLDPRVDVREIFPHL